ncbi:esterase/lipase family protein [Aeromonas sanarellii]|uniref:esterase/lipase family protein n=1 Tax=Aeromonas sanarellii TaxID=633415 RepID=UPI0038D0C2CC
MSNRDVLIVHGWSDTSKSFSPLVVFLKSAGFNAVSLWLGDYISLDDDVKIEDVAKRMEALIRDKEQAGELKAPFDMVVHSTGGLVARQWISTYYIEDVSKCPLKRLIMLAPANFGSKLASTGQSMLGRVLKGWNNWFHTGKEMLNALELSSPFQWDLVQRDLLVPDGVTDRRAVYGKNGVWPFVLVGTHPYPSALRQIVNENGADGTVRAAAANLNTRGVTIDFAKDEFNPEVRFWQNRSDTVFPFAVLPDRTHASIIEPAGPDVKADLAAQQRLGAMIVSALNCDTFADYQQMAVDWRQVSENTASLAGNDASRTALFLGADQNVEFFHQYIQVNVQVLDDHGADVTDYVLEFSGPDYKRNDAPTVYFHREVLEHVHVNGANAAYRCFFVDRTDLLNEFYNRIGKNFEKILTMSISAKAPGNNVKYFSDAKRGAPGEMIVHSLDDNAETRWLQRNSTQFVRIIIPRSPSDKVFQLKR